MAKALTAYTLAPRAHARNYAQQLQDNTSIFLSPVSCLDVRGGGWRKQGARRRNGRVTEHCLIPHPLWNSGTFSNGERGERTQASDEKKSEV